MSQHSKWRSFWYIYGVLMVIELIYQGGGLPLMSIPFNALVALIIWGVYRMFRKW